MASVFFIASLAPTSTESVILYDKAFGNGRAALEHAKNEAKKKFGDNALIRNISEDRCGVFIDVQGNLALLSTYHVVAIPLMK